MGTKFDQVQNAGDVAEVVAGLMVSKEHWVFASYGPKGHAILKFVGDYLEGKGLNMDEDPLINICAANDSDEFVLTVSKEHLSASELTSILQEQANGKLFGSIDEADRKGGLIIPCPEEGGVDMMVFSALVGRSLHERIGRNRISDFIN